MKKILKLIRAWWLGEEFEAEFYIPLPTILLFGAIILFLMIKGCS